MHAMLQPDMSKLWKLLASRATESREWVGSRKQSNRGSEALRQDLHPHKSWSFRRVGTDKLSLKSS